MGPVSLYLTLAAASVAAQVPQHDHAQEPARVQREALTLPAQASPIIYRLPGRAVGLGVPDRIALARDFAWPQATPPPMPADPFETPTSDWWQGNSAIRRQAVRVKFGWDL